MIKIKGEEKSYEAHNKEYESFDSLEWHKSQYEKYKLNNDFKNLGFEKIIADNKNVRDLHIDFGSGAGWLLTNTAHFFKKVVGVEPSESAVKMSIFFNKDNFNVEHVNAGMIEGYEKINIITPTFFTTSTVLSHIEDKTVLDFLKLINNSPIDSILLFQEPYGKNRQQYLWHVRSKQWWAKHLDNWELSFLNIVNGGYLRGIEGKNVGKNNVSNKYQMNYIERLKWFFNGIISRFKMVFRILINPFFK